MCFSDSGFLTKYDFFSEPWASQTQVLQSCCCTHVGLSELQLQTLWFDPTSPQVHDSSDIASTACQHVMGTLFGPPLHQASISDVCSCC